MKPPIVICTAIYSADFGILQKKDFFGFILMKLDFSLSFHKHSGFPHKASLPEGGSCAKREVASNG